MSGFEPASYKLHECIRWISGQVVKLSRECPVDEDHDGLRGGGALDNRDAGAATADVLVDQAVRRDGVDVCHGKAGAGIFADGQGASVDDDDWAAGASQSIRQT